MVTLAEFEGHELWTSLTALETQLDLLQSSDQPLQVELASELAARISYVRAAYRSRGRTHAIVTPRALTGVYSQINNAVGQMQNAVAHVEPNRTAFANQAVESLRAASETQIAQWPSPFPTAPQGKGGESFYDDVLNAEYEATEKAAAVSRQLSEFEAAAAAKVAKIQAFADETRQLIESQKGRIDSVIDEARKEISGVPGAVDARFEGWADNSEKVFSQRFSRFQKRLGEDVLEADGLLRQIHETEEKYQALVNLDTAERLAGHYDKEATRLRIVGGAAYSLGIVFLLAAAIPLAASIVQSFDQTIVRSSTEIAWDVLLTRFLFAVIVAGGATVAIRLGGRLLNQATATKRFAMELRTFEPFLSGVSADPTEVDKARIALVSQAFGKAYVSETLKVDETKEDDVVSVSLLTRVVDLVSRAESK